MSLYEAVPQFIKMLRNLDRWLVTATEYAKKKSFDAEVLLQARLAPDQYPLVRQVQIACDSAKFTTAHLSGQKAPAHPDTEKTLPEVHARIASCIAFLESVKEADFQGAGERRISAPWMAGKWVAGAPYLLQLAYPNFYFHITTAYAILRHNGVELGKRDFLGDVQLNDA
jgi:hypothetical protein